MADTTDGKRIRSVERAVEILEALKRTGGSTITELTEEVDLTAGAIHTQLATLMEAGYVTQDGFVYQLGPGCLLLGAEVRNNSELMQAAKGEADKLANETGEVTRLVMEHDRRLFVIHEKFGENAVGRSHHIEKRARARSYFHCTAEGKAILAALPDEDVDAILDEIDLTPHTPSTLSSRADLREELETVREQGYALEREEQLMGVRGVGVAVRRQDGSVAGAIGVSGPAGRLEDGYFSEELPERVKQAANVCEIHLQTGDTDL